MHNVGRWREMAVVAGILLTASTTITQTTESPTLQGPIIIPEENEIILQNGGNYTIICKGNKDIQFKQQEPAESLSLPFYTNQRRHAQSDDEYAHVIALDLFNVNEHAVGYYACFDNTLNYSDVLKLNDLKEEPNNTDHITYIYVYVNGSDYLFAPMSEILIANDDSNVVIACRPTSPDIKVELLALQNYKYKKENETYLPKIGYLLKSNIKSSYKCNGRRGNETNWKHAHKDNPPPMPNVKGLEYFLEGETFILNCSVPCQKNSPINLEWRIPQSASEDLWSRIINDTNEYNVTDGRLYYNITVVNATKQDAGEYTCISKRISEQRSKFRKKFISQPFMKLSEMVKNKGLIREITQSWVKLQSSLECHPPAQLTYLKNFNEEIVIDGKKYVVHLKPDMGIVEFMIWNASVFDTANYTVIASNKYLTRNLTYDIRVKSTPQLYLNVSDDKSYVIKEENRVMCKATGYPLPKITWYFKSLDNVSGEILKSYDEVHSLHQLTSYLDISQLETSGVINCSASNSRGNTWLTKRIILYELSDGFGIKDRNNTWFVHGQEVTLTCVASLYDYLNVTWADKELASYNVQYSENEFSFVAELKISDIAQAHAGEYTCIGYRRDGIENNDSITITVEEINPPYFIQPSVDVDEDVYPYQQVPLTCKAAGVPRPEIEWFKDGEPLVEDENITSIKTRILGHTVIESIVTLHEMQENLGGKYVCSANNQFDKQLSKSFNLVVHTKSPNKVAYLSVIIVIFILLLIFIVYLILKIRKEKLFRKELAKAGLLYFKEGVTKSLNPDLGIDEQAELLPYDDRFEFPPEKLILGKQLGSGAYGVVYKAEARGIVNAEETTIVAVKMVKKTADNLSIKALASELKIMVHMGKHINIVNLLGACTKNVGKRELSVIVEYCKFGNIHNYMIKHREVFIDQLNGNTDKNMGRVNRGFSCSSGNSGTHSDYFGSNHTQDTDHTFLNTANSNRSGIRKDNAMQQVELGKVSESGYVQPMWRSNYESDYSYDGHTPRPLYSRDLLCWAFQIARGMEYLACRKVLHGDLAARNILLAEDNVVKICDFGLARSIYKTDEYQKKENSPLPLKWLAVECMTDRIFSTQSDVWSFGIVLWELFTLSKTPYPSISPSELLPYLLAGKRLDKPRYADDRIYEIMRQCWEKKPTSRPSFTKLQETLGTFLEDNVRNHYVDLNSMYMDMNVATRAAGQEDYLAMMRAPDYNNHVTPSPHEYVNDVRSFFPPTPTLQDDEGYLQMSPANRQPAFDPHVQGGKFEFDARKLNSRQEATAHGSELTPMLTLNNLPARSGSESDHEGNSSPYLNVCPRIEEETDEVFETKLNLKNVSKNRAVTNPTYIAFDADLEKKPQNNSYVNISNGLVK